MKKTSRLFAVVLSFCLVAVMLTSCRKSPMNADTFVKIAEESGYEICDITEQYDPVPQIGVVKVAVSENRDYQIEFYEISDQDNAKKLFLVQCDEIDGFKGATVESDSSNGQNYARRCVVTKGQYLAVIYIDNTMIYVPPTDAENKKQIDEFLKKLNY